MDFNEEISFTAKLNEEFVSIPRRDSELYSRKLITFEICSLFISFIHPDRFSPHQIKKISDHFRI
jgi:hypothetical protein